MSEEVIYKLHRYPSGELEEFEQVQELIRCKECKYAEECERIVVFKLTDDIIEGRRIDFCPYGERREP